MRPQDLTTLKPGDVVTNGRRRLSVIAITRHPLTEELWAICAKGNYRIKITAGSTLSCTPHEVFCDKIESRGFSVGVVRDRALKDGNDGVILFPLIASDWEILA